MLHRILSITSLLVLFSTLVFSQNSIEELCLSQQESELVDIINGFRTENGMPEVKISRSLCYVADVHAKDLYFFYDERSGGSMHSWSDKGRWNACLYQNPKTDGRCMHNKPSELTSYQGLGFELVYWDNTRNESQNAFKTWLETNDNRNLLLNEGKYVAFDWNAVGVRVFKGYVVVWFGTTSDDANPMYVCGEMPVVSNDTIDSAEAKAEDHKLYYVVVASYHTPKDAERDKIRWEKRFFEPLKIVENNGKHRLAVGAYNDNAAAEKALARIKKQVKDAWIISL